MEASFQQDVMVGGFDGNLLYLYFNHAMALCDLLSELNVWADSL